MGKLYTEIVMDARKFGQDLEGAFKRASKGAISGGVSGGLSGGLIGGLKGIERGGIGGAIGGGIAGAFGASSVVSSIVGSAIGILEGILEFSKKAYEELRKGSKSYDKASEQMKRAFEMTTKPIGDFLAQVMSPFIKIQMQLVRKQLAEANKEGGIMDKFRKGEIGAKEALEGLNELFKPIFIASVDLKSQFKDIAGDTVAFIEAFKTIIDTTWLNDLGAGIKSFVQLALTNSNELKDMRIKAYNLELEAINEVARSNKDMNAGQLRVLKELSENVQSNKTLLEGQMNLIQVGFYGQFTFIKILADSTFTVLGETLKYISDGAKALTNNRVATGFDTLQINTETGGNALDRLNRELMRNPSVRLGLGAYGE